MMVALLLKTTDLAALDEAMAQEFGDSPELFDHDPVLLDLAAVRDAAEAFDFPAVKLLLRGYRLNAVAVRGGSEGQMQAALAADLSPAPDAPVPAAKPAAAKQGGAAAPAAQEGDEGEGGAFAPASEKDPDQLELLPAEQLPDAGAGPGAGPAGRDDPAADAAAANTAAPDGDGAAATPPAAKPAHAPRPTLVVDRPLRSGQQVYARGSDLVVLAAVNFGAEVIADGHIHVYAPLRGRAVAGARGDASARIFCTSMQAQLLSIAGVYRTSDTPLPKGLNGKPVQVRLDGENLRIDALSLE